MGLGERREKMENGKVIRGKESGRKEVRETKNLGGAGEWGMKEVREGEGKEKETGGKAALTLDSLHVPGFMCYIHYLF